MLRIGVRELRQNASKYLRLVKAGESIEVTERGVPVAVLRPIAKDQTPEGLRAQLIAEGKLIPGTQDWRNFTPIEPVEGEKPLSEILREMREDERY